MHICFISQEYPPETGWGGIGTYTFEMAHGLAKYGHQVTVIAHANGVEKVETYDNVQVHRILPAPAFDNKRGLWRLNKYWPGFAWAALKRLQLVHNTKPIHLVEAAEGRADSLFVLLKRQRLKTIVRLHTALMFLNQINGIAPNYRHKIQYWQEKRVLQSADAITSPSLAILELTRAWTKFDKKKIAVIPNPVNTKTFSPEPVQRLSEVLYVGRLEHQKIFVLAEAIPSILKRNKNVTIRFLGKDSLDNNGMSWQERILASVPSGQRQRLVFQHARREELVNYYRKAGMATLPSVWENFPYAILEAMACGTASVCTCVGGYPELIEDGISGILVPPSDPAALVDTICGLADDPAQQERLGKRARERVLDCFAIERIVPPMVEFYQSVLD